MRVAKQRLLSCIMPWRGCKGPAPLRYIVLTIEGQENMRVYSTKSCCALVCRVSTEVLFFTSCGIRNFLKNIRNYAKFRGIFTAKFSRNSGEFRMYLNAEFRRYLNDPDSKFPLELKKNSCPFSKNHGHSETFHCQIFTCTACFLAMLISLDTDFKRKQSVPWIFLIQGCKRRNLCVHF